ncbi:MAG TPA: carbamoyltransferase C-terminal domain-containing protein [Longimicrobiales bacterium]
MHVLGINAYHAGASACLLRDGALVAAVEEERLNRQKYWAGFPVLAVRKCLELGGIQPQDLHHVAISRDPNANLLRKAFWAVRRNPRIGYLTDRLINRRQVARIDETFCAALGLQRQELTAEFHHVEHHRAHMASAFFVSPFERAAILSVDGMGDFVSTMWGSGEGNRITVADAVHFPHSLGFLYTAVSQWLGFTSFGDEGKVMGLASYGSPRVDGLDELVRVQRDGSFELNMDYFRHEREGVEMTWAEGTPTLGPLYSDRFLERFGAPRSRSAPIERMHEDMAATVQHVLEHALEQLLHRLHGETGMTDLCLAGGVALNGVFNGKIRSRSRFRRVYVQPAANDAGTALGAASYVWHQQLGKPRAYVMEHAYTGPAYGNHEIEDALRAAGLSYRTLDEVELARTTARLIASGNVVGWFQHRMEWGPRALGARSILADPRRAEMRAVLNARIKQREPFRPFAPSLLEAAVDDYLEGAQADPFMVTVYPVRAHKKSEIPAVTHVDGTARLQSVTAQQAPHYARVLEAFAEETGVPVLVNTSFNENEPIVCAPADAIDCFQRTRMDALAIGNCLVQRRHE